MNKAPMIGHAGSNDDDSAVTRIDTASFTDVKEILLAWPICAVGIEHTYSLRDG